MTFSRRCAFFALTLAVALTPNLAMIEASEAWQAPSQAAGQSVILINNARIFDGISDQLKQGNVLIEGRKITRISPDHITAPPGARVIDGGGRTLMPGLTDAH